jgi:hypothetical protein
LGRNSEFKGILRFQISELFEIENEIWLIKLSFFSFLVGICLGGTFKTQKCYQICSKGLKIFFKKFQPRIDMIIFLGHKNLSLRPQQSNIKKPFPGIPPNDSKFRNSEDIKLIFYLLEWLGG